MPFPTSEKVTPLRKMRRDCGLDIASIMEKGKGLTEAFPRSKEALYMIELRGTRNLDIIESLAQIYDLPVPAVSEAAKHSIYADNLLPKVLTRC